MNKAFTGFALLAVPVLVAAASPSNASQWVYITEGVDKSVYIDFDSVRGTGSTRTAWIRYVGTLRTCLKSYKIAYRAFVLSSNRRTIKCTIA
jgi:hypothetical protein